jgi:hypothetical protein
MLIFHIVILLQILNTCCISVFDNSGAQLTIRNKDFLCNDFTAKTPFITGAVVVVLNHYFPRSLNLALEINILLVRNENCLRRAIVPHARMNACPTRVYFRAWASSSTNKGSDKGGQ